MVKQGAKDVRFLNVLKNKKPEKHDMHFLYPLFYSDNAEQMHKKNCLQSGSAAVVRF